MAVAAKSSPEAVVTTQSRNLTVDSLLRTVAVEAAVHQLDLEPVLPDPPATSVLAELRRTLDRLLGSVADVGWTDVGHIRVRTGRLPMSTLERAALGPLADRFPLFG